jgi:putative transposase
MLSRRTTQRQFLLRPDDATNNNYVYCLAEAALRFGIVVLITQMMSNHHHTIFYDPHGLVNEFMEHFHKMFARSQNALRGRWENLWASEPPSLVQLVDREDVIRKMVYVATNPVKDGLVERVHHWPAANALAALMHKRPLRAHRPSHFFRENGRMPETVELELSIPEHLGDRDSLVAEVAARSARLEEEFRTERIKAGRPILGRRRVLDQDWRDSPRSKEARREIRPRVAAKNQWARIATLQQNKEFIRAYKIARKAWKLGTPVVFPAGTYWLRKFANVPTEPLMRGSFAIGPPSLSPRSVS